MALPDVQMASIRLARVTFATRRAAWRGGTRCDRSPLGGSAERLSPVTNATRRVGLCDPGAARVRDHASTCWVNTCVCRLPLDPTDECRSTGTTTYQRGLEGWIRNAYMLASACQR